MEGGMMVIATWIIAIAAIANFVVYFLLWNATKKNVDVMRKSAEEMAKSVKLQEKAFIADALFEAKSGGNAGAEKRNAFIRVFPEYQKIMDDK